MIFYALLGLIIICLLFTFFRRITRWRLVNAEREVYALWTLLTCENKVSILSQLQEISPIESSDEVRLDQLFSTVLKEHCMTMKTADDINLEMLREQILTLNDSVARNDNLS